MIRYEVFRVDNQNLYRDHRALKKSVFVDEVDSMLELHEDISITF